MERALLVAVKMDSKKDVWSFEDTCEELEELVASAGVAVVDTVTCHRERPTPNLYIGKGKVEEIAVLCDELEATTVIFSDDLSGTQQRNLEDKLGRKTIDRTQLILDIFARHARSLEGKMQVELAQLKYLMPRLVGKGIMLSRLGGGIGTRGPGEQKLEVDRRHVRRRIEKLQSDLKDVGRHRYLIRKKRKESHVPHVTLVGYTNAGKSTLINALTGSTQAVHDQLFTTLDPVSKGINLANGERVIISDTVGFLHHLPHHLIEAFKATLEEVVEADLLIHVLDAGHHLLYTHAEAVSLVLKELGAESIPVITALNKIDLVESPARIAGLLADFPNAVSISAKYSQHLEELLRSVEGAFQRRMTTIAVRLPHSRMDIVHRLYKEGKVEEIRYLQKGIEVRGLFPAAMAYALLKNKEIEQIDRES